MENDSYQLVIRLLLREQVPWQRIETLAGTHLNAYLRRAQTEQVIEPDRAALLSAAYQCHLLAEGRARTNKEHTEALAADPNAPLAYRVLNLFYDD